MKYLYIYLFLLFLLVVQAQKPLGDGLVLAPNPATTYTHVISKDTTKKIKSLFVYNALGEQIIRNENMVLNTKYTMDVSKLREGMYIIKVLFSDNSLAVSTLIKSDS